MEAVYRGLTWMAAPALRLLLERRLANGKEDPDRVLERTGVASVARPGGSLSWVHGASVGELVAALPLVRALTDRRLADTVLVTTGTVTSARLARERLPSSAIHQFVPLDHPVWVRRFYDHWRPDLALWLESELWPNLLSEARRRGVGAMLLNARVTERSLRRWRLLPGLSRSTMAAFDLCLAPDEEQARRLGLLGAPRVRVTGDLKAASPPLPVDERERRALSASIAGRTAWLAASTHPGEEEAVARAHEELGGKIPGLLTIVAPRHPERGAEIARKLDARGLACARRSLGEAVSDDTEVYVVDTLGELGLVYRLAPVAFVGGSLVPHGGHNLAEAARLHCALVCGPHLHNFAGVSRRLAEASALTTVNDPESLAAEIGMLLRDHEMTEKRAAAARRVAQEDAAAGERALAEILEAIADIPPRDRTRPAGGDPPGGIGR